MKVIYFTYTSAKMAVRRGLLDFSVPWLALLLCSLWAALLLSFSLIGILNIAACVAGLAGVWRAHCRRQTRPFTVYRARHGGQRAMVGVVAVRISGCPSVFLSFRVYT